MQPKSTLNPRQERFCQLVALASLPIGECAKQAGFSDKSARTIGPRLLRNDAVASRINQLKREAEQPAGTRSIQSITRQELAELLAKVIKAGFSKPEKAGPHDALKASELLTKLCGWNEPERALHQHQHIHVDASLIEQLRAGYSALAARSKPGLELAASLLSEGQSSSEVIAPEDGQVLDASAFKSAVGAPEP
jgi:phage terminase small subunit